MTSTNMGMNPVVRAARQIIEYDVSCADGHERHNSLAGGVLALAHRMPRWAAEEAVRSAIARGCRTSSGLRVSFAQMRYIQHVAANPGCCIADVHRACRRTAEAGHYWVYSSVRRLIRRGLLCATPGPGNRVTLRVPME